ncbi:LysR substrate-binding domain-containing protein [Roseibium sp. MMSF_3544]|uniref:LysR substrate-binding domain-containing protein n=1 Tax=unclassified Roseibium TaxID=2629323 RepID=UPI00273FA13E|nr:LysR substrate-binding domain-containing protein [Roseibium sp. MMSF_3544]
MQRAVLTSKIRLRQLRCFVVVARKKSFVQAAEELGLTQPAVSRSVRELEQVIGHNLFDRSQRGAQLTSRGRALMEAAELGLLQISQGIQEATTEVDLTETIRVGALPNVCSQFLPGVIRDFKAAFPDVTVSVIPGPNADLLSDLRSGKVDIVIGRLSTGDAMRGLVFEALFDEPLVFVVGQSHVLASGNATLEDVLEYPLMLPPPGTIIRQEVDRFLASQGVVKLRNVIETTSSEFQRAYLQCTDCVAAVPRGVVQQDLERGALIQLPFGEQELTGPVGLTTNPEIGRSQALSELLTRIRQRP